MLSSSYRIRLIEICDRIANQEEVSLSDVIWAEKLGRANRSAGSILRKARRKAANPEMTEDSLDGFLNALDLGDPDPTQHKTDFKSVDEIVDFFKRDDTDDEIGDRNWRRRD
jgi:hypothetical protein